MNSIVIFVLAVAFFLSVMNKKGWEISILLIAFALRLAILLLDYYQIVDIPFSGNDSENFHNFALAKLRGDDVHYTHYTDFLTVIYRLTDASRFFAQAINVLFSYFTILLVRRCCILANVNQKTYKVAIVLISIMPSMIAFSGILLREAWIQFFLMISVCYFIKWYMRGGPINAILCITAALLTAYMHEGMIGALFGYALGFILFNRKRQKETISAQSFIALLVLSIVGVALIANFSSIGGKLGRVSEEDFLEAQLQLNEAGSAYLQWMVGSSYAVVLLLSPIRMFYFLFSPIPFDWRGIMDVIVFVIDSMVYFILIIIGFKHYKRKRPLRKYLLLSFLFVTLIFSIGTNNSGTALRHRAKIFPLLVIAFSVASSENVLVNDKRTYYVQ